MTQTLAGWLNPSYAPVQRGVFEAVPFLFVTGVFFVLSYGPIVLKLYWPYLRTRKFQYGFAEIVDSQVVSGPKPGADPERVFFWPEVTYTYFAEGRSITSKRLGVAPVYYRQREEAAEVAERYKPGEKVRIHFNLEQPTEVLLRMPEAPDEIGVLLFGLVFLVVSAGLAYLVMDFVPDAVLDFFRSSPIE